MPTEAHLRVVAALVAVRVVRVVPVPRPEGAAGVLAPRDAAREGRRLAVQRRLGDQLASQVRLVHFLVVCEQRLELLFELRCAHTACQTHRETETQTYRERQTQTQRHRQRHRHRDTDTDTERQTQTQTQTQTHTDRQAERERESPWPRPNCVRYVWLPME